MSDHGEKAPNIVYKARLSGDYWVAVKSFPKSAWPDARQFAVFISNQFLYIARFILFAASLYVKMHILFWSLHPLMVYICKLHVLCW